MGFKLKSQLSFLGSYSWTCLFMAIAVEQQLRSARLVPGLAGPDAGLDPWQAEDRENTDAESLE